MYSQLPIVPFDALLADAESPKAEQIATSRTLLHNADVIYAVQPGWAHEVLIFGREKLQRIAASEIPEGARVLRVGLASENGQLDGLLALVHETKGSHDYVGPPSQN